MPQLARRWIAYGLIAAFPALAAADAVVLTSGNRMTGTIRELSRGQLTFSIDGAGTVDIDWNNVEGLESDEPLEIDLASGVRLSGTIATTTPGQLEVRRDAGPTTVALRDVVRMVPVGATFRDRTSGSIDVGFDFLNANDELDLTLNLAAENRTVNYLTKADLALLISRVDDETVQRRNRFDVTSRRFLQERWFVLGRFEAEENLALSLDTRLMFAATFGRTLVQTNRTVFALYAGLDYDIEDYQDLDTDQSVEAIAALEWDWFEVSGDTEVSTLATTYISLDSSRTRFDLDVSLRRDIFTNVYWSLSVYESYDSDPPAGFENSDLGVSLSIGRSF